MQADFSIKYFLQCEHCGQFNDASSEYLIFCSGCRKKMHGNFRDWHRQNPDSALEVYHLAMCLPESVVFPSPPITANERRPWKIRSYARIAILTLLCILSFYFIFRDSVLVEKITSVISWSDDNWERKVYGNYGLSIESPHTLVDISTRLPKADNSLIMRIQAFSSPPAEIVNIVAISTEFASGVGPVDIQGSISGFVSQIRGMPGITDFKIRQEETEISGINGFGQTGSFLKEGKPMSFRSAGITRGRILWQVMIIYPGQEASYGEVAQKVMESIEILYNSAV